MNRFISVLGAIMPFAVIALGVLMAASPVKFVQLTSRRRTTWIKWGDADKVAQSVSMRLQYRLAGIAIALLGLGIVWSQFGL
jgi:hypothetical protein